MSSSSLWKRWGCLLSLLLWCSRGRLSVAVCDALQVTRKVLGVEEKRDGVTKVTLRANSAEEGAAAEGRPSYYTIEYATVSSRGTKIFCCKYCIANKKLYVLQAQASLVEFDNDESVRAALRGIAKSFTVAAS